jgi:protein-disulfide isomerase
MRNPVRGGLRPEVQSRDHILGPIDAPITLVEYGDYECESCAQAQPVIHALRRHFGDRLRFVFRNFPLTKLHPHALHAAEASESVAVYGPPGSYWAMHDSLFRHQQDSPDALDDAHLVRYANAVGADGKRVAAHLRARTFEGLIRSDYVGGVRSGVTGTPTFFTGDRMFEGDWTDVPALVAALQASATRRRRRRNDSSSDAVAHVARRA